MGRRSRARAVIETALLVAAVVLVVLGARRCYEHFRGVEVELTNGDVVVLRSVAVHVGGSSYEIGDLAPGETRALYVQPDGECEVALSFTDDAGRAIRRTAGGYLEPGYTGWMKVTVTREHARIDDEKIQLW